MRTQLIKMNLVFPKLFLYSILSSEEVGKEKPSKEFFTVQTNWSMVKLQYQ
ncbi:hypothetical protein LEP1GSC170_5438 [Leptospira interrogans serovar Bataviae str. HAI135]|nr:hypothetical protein LEP1GSC170_5438 [Leptospira interrogans serovar Bataviae str. HAI135]